MVKILGQINFRRLRASHSADPLNISGVSAETSEACGGCSGRSQQMSTTTADQAYLSIYRLRPGGTHAISEVENLDFHL